MKLPEQNNTDATGLSLNNFIYKQISIKSESKVLGNEIIKLFPCSIQISMRVSLQINFMIPLTVDLWTFISRAKMFSTANQESV